jgi:hypothetical protein
MALRHSIGPVHNHNGDTNMHSHANRRQALQWLGASFVSALPLSFALAQA